MNEAAAKCQCVECMKYVARDREVSLDPKDHRCTECGGNLPLAALRKSLSDPLSVELLGLLTEECGEVSQRIGKIMRWGWDADFEGTTQRHKLETEIGDVCAVIALAIHNGLVTRAGVHDAAVAKLRKLIEDALGPRQRLQIADVPTAGFVQFAFTQPGEQLVLPVLLNIFALLSQLWDHSSQGD